MQLRLIFALAVLLQSVPDPHLQAWLDSPGASTVSWSSDRRLCLYYDGAFAGCWPAGRVTVTFGRVGPLDGSLRPREGGRYCLQDVRGASVCARLRKRAVYLPLVLR